MRLKCKECGWITVFNITKEESDKNPKRRKCRKCKSELTILLIGYS